MAAMGARASRAQGFLAGSLRIAWRAPAARRRQVRHQSVVSESPLLDHIDSSRKLAAAAAVPMEENQEPRWLAIRTEPMSPLQPQPPDSYDQPPPPGSGDLGTFFNEWDLELAEDVARKLHVLASHDSLHDEFCKRGYLLQQLCALEFDAADALLVLHSLERMQVFDRRFMATLTDRVECKYFSMEVGLPMAVSRDRQLSVSHDVHSVARLFKHADNFRSMVDSLPLVHKVKLILGDDVERQTGRAQRPKPTPERDPKNAWRTMDPVEMELKEREHFQKARIKVMRMRDVRARVTRMSPGKRLRATLAAHFMQTLPSATLEGLAVMSHICAFPKVRSLHGDLRHDFHEALSRRLCAICGKGEGAPVAPYLLALTSGMREFEGPEAFRAWRTVLLPALTQLRAAESAQILELLAQQRHFHPRLRGCRDAAEPRGVSGSPSPAMIANRAAELFIAVLGARQVIADGHRFEAVAGPLRYVLKNCERDIGLGVETIADSLSALVSSGVHDVALAQALADAFTERFREDIVSGARKLSPYNPPDLAGIAHAAAALLAPDASGAILDLVWEAAKGSLHEAEPHLALMLLNAVVRGGSERLLKSAEVFNAVDELLVQKLDFKPEALGRLG